jgi:PAS domain S-box-containing protein
MRLETTGVAWPELESQDPFARIRDDRDRLAALLNCIQDEVWFLDADGRVVLANPAALREIEASSSGELDVPGLAGGARRPDGPIRPVGESAALRALRGDVVVEPEEILLTPASGEMRCRQVSSSPVRDRRGSIIGAVAVVRDVTEQRRAGAERERLVTAIEQAAETVVVTDAQGTIVYVNPAFEAVTGYSRAEALGRNPRFLGGGSEDPSFHRAMRETIGSGKTWKGRIVSRKKDGAHYTEEATISPVRDASGIIRSYVAVTRDITGHLALEAQFHQSQKLESVGRLAGGVAHDFNNLLTVILLCGEAIRKALEEGQAPSLDDVDEIIGAGRQASDLTRQLLAFARKQIVAPVILDLNDAVEKSNKMLRRVIGEDIRLVEQFQVDLWPVRCDPGLLDRVVMNLVVNARDAMPGGGTLTLATENVTVREGDAVPDAEMRPGPYVKLSVKDTGTGMTPEVREHIFEPFFTTKGPAMGTGLGLATVFGIVKQSGAHLDVHSVPGGGTTFEIYFPRASLEEVVPEEQAPARSPGTETVLVVEDDPRVREVAVRTLRSAGYRVLAAGGAEQALALLQREHGPLHLVLTDVVMPGPGGRELARRITELRPGVRTLYMSGHAHDAISKHCVVEEGIDFLPKPFTSAVLLSRVRESLDRT